MRSAAREVSLLSVVPYSGRPRGAAVLLGTGETVPGVRVESASFSLVIPAVVNAITTAIALGFNDIAAVAASTPLTARDVQYVRAFIAAADEIDGAVVRTARPGVPRVGESVSPVLLDFAESDGITAASLESDGIALARHAARRAHVPESMFPVGCVAATESGWVPGVNVEHPDWTLVLCAERNMLGTLASFGIPIPDHVFLSCPRDHDATPCGACRQLLSELSPNVMVWSDRGSRAPEQSSIDFLLPGSFTGAVLRG